MTRGPITPEGSEGSYERFHFAPAFRVGDTIHVSGVIGSNADGSIPESAADEYANAFAALTATLAAAGATPDDIVEMTSFHTDMPNTLREFSAARDVVLSAPWPAWTAIGCTALAIPGARAEVKVTAVVDS